MVEMMGFAGGDDLQPTRDDYSTTTNYRCLDEIITNKARQVKRIEPGPPSSSFKIKVEILKTIEPTRSCLIILDVQDQGRIFEGFIEPTQNHSR